MNFLRNALVMFCAQVAISGVSPAHAAPGLVKLSLEAPIVQGSRQSDTTICVGLDCTSLIPRSSNYDLLALAQINTGLSAIATWIEDRTSGYSLCAYSRSHQIVCERVSISHLEQIKLGFRDTPTGDLAMRLLFPPSENGPTKSGRAVIGQVFASRFTSARELLATRLAADRSDAALPSAYAVQRVVSRINTGVNSNSCDPTDTDDYLISKPSQGQLNSNAEGADPRMIDTGGGCGGGAGDDGGDYGDGPGNPIGYGDLPSSGINEACVAACESMYENMSEGCRSLPAPQARAVCWAAAAVAFGACLATCR